MKKKALFMIAIAFFILLSPLLIAFTQLLFSDSSIVPVPLTHYYLARINSGENERSLLISYMIGQGYALETSNSNAMFFTKDAQTLEVKDTYIKCVIRDGGLSTNFTESH